MKSIKFLFILFLFPLYAQAQEIVVNNNSQEVINDYTIELSPEELKLPFGNYIVKTQDETVPIELVYDIHGNQKAVFSVSTIKANSKTIYTIKKGIASNYPKRTYAELSHKIGGEFVGNRYEGGYSWVKPNQLSVDSSFMDHAYYIKYEGPGWESDKMAYRFYLDWRNGIDVFGKQTEGIVLPAVGVDGYDNYHAIADWGMDILKVGKSLGLGSIATWDGEKAVRVEKRDSVSSSIEADGKIRSQVLTKYYGWQIENKKVNLTSLISIDAGNSASHIELLADKNIDNFATGIIKDSKAELIVGENRDGEWSFIATFGKQSLNDDMMGLVVFFRTKQLREITEDELSHVVILNPIDNYVDYYIMPTWELSSESVIDITEFKAAIQRMLHKLNNPLKIGVN